MNIHKFKHFRYLNHKLSWTIATKIVNNTMSIGYVVFNEGDGKFIKKTACEIARQRCDENRLTIAVPNRWPNTHHMLTALALKAVGDDLESNPYRIPNPKINTMLTSINKMIDRRCQDYVSDLIDSTYNQFNEVLANDFVLP